MDQDMRGRNLMGKDMGKANSSMPREARMMASGMKIECMDKELFTISSTYIKDMRLHIY